MSRGVFITFEGTEGCGKSTQIALLQRALQAAGFRVYVTREPGGTEISDAIRKILLDKRHRRMTPLCETLLYMASRAQLVDQEIRPRLRRRFVVLCDRWSDATLAYQGYAGGVDKKWILELGQRVTGGLKPDLSLFLDLPLEVGLRRVAKRGAKDRMELKKISFHRKVRAGFLQIAKKEPGRFKRIALRETDFVSDVTKKIKKVLRGSLASRGMRRVK